MEPKLLVGYFVGLFVGDIVGLIVGPVVGDIVGLLVGPVVGDSGKFCWSKCLRWCNCWYIGWCHGRIGSRFS